MSPDGLQTLKDLSPIAAAVGALYLVVKMFISYLVRRDVQLQTAIDKFDKRLEDMSRAFFATNRESNQIIGNHIDHSTRALEKSAETNKSLEVAVKTLTEVVAALTKSSTH